LFNSIKKFPVMKYGTIVLTLLFFLIILATVSTVEGSVPAELSKTAPYAGIPAQGEPNWGDLDREFIQAGHNDRIRQNGTIYQIRFAVANASALKKFYFTVWRQNGSNYDRIATTDNLIDDISKNGINVINLPNPIEGVQEGDFYGYSINASASALYVDKNDKKHLTYYVDGHAMSITDYNWMAGYSEPYVFVIEPYMENPYIVFIGDSIISGKPEHISFIETDKTTNIPASIQNQWARKVDRTYQNMGYSGDRTSNLESRFISDVVDLSPEFVLIEGGINDVTSGISSKVILNNWESMIKKAYYNNITPVIMLILPDSRKSYEKSNQITYINEQLMAMAANYSPSIVVDARCYVGVERSSGPPGNCWDINPSYTMDGLHYNSAGNERIAQAIKDSFRFVHGKQGLYNLIQSDGTIIYNTNLSNAVNTSWRMASTAGGSANVSYNTPASFTINSGTIDWLNIENLSSNQVCKLYLNDDKIDSKEALNGSVNFTENILYSGTYHVQCTAPSTPSTITSWSNSKTNNNNLTVTVNISEQVNFRATADQTIDTWNWYKDGVDQNNNFDTLSTSWDSEGTKLISINATNSNGISNTITWTITVVTVNAPSSQPQITSWKNSKTDNNNLTVTVNISEQVNFRATADQTIDTWNWYKDGVDQDNNFDTFSTSWDSEGTKLISINATNSNGISNTITWTVTVNVANSNETSDNITITVTANPEQSDDGGTLSPGGSGGGSGGGGRATGEPYSNILISEKYEKDLIAGTPVAYTFFQPEHSIYEILVTGKANEFEIILICEVLKGTSKRAKTPAPGIVYKNENIWITSKLMKEGLIRFKVENSWLESNNLADSDIRLVKWNNSKWVQLNTTETKKDSTHTYYEVRTDSFSSFAVTGLKDVKTQEDAPVEITLKSIQLDTEDPVKPAGTERTTETEGTTGTETAGPNKEYVAFFVVLAMAVFLALYILVRVK